MLAAQLPNDVKFYSIGQTAKAVGVSPITLRRWEKAGLLASRRTQGNQRRFSAQDITAIRSLNDPDKLRAYFYHSDYQNNPGLNFAEPKKLNTDQKLFVFPVFSWTQKLKRVLLACLIIFIISPVVFTPLIKVPENLIKPIEYYREKQFSAQILGAKTKLSWEKVTRNSEPVIPNLSPIPARLWQSLAKCGQILLLQEP